MIKNISGFPGYQVTSSGKIINKHGRILKDRITKFGYIRAMLSVNKKPKQLLVHRIVAEHFVPNPQNKPDVNHKDGNKKNNHYSNLEWVTKSENTKHASNHFLAVRGEKNGRSKLTWKQIKEIREIYPSLSCYSLAKIYQVNQTTIARIVNNSGWKEDIFQ